MFMETLRKYISDFFSLIIPKENDEYYTWSQIIIGIVILAFLFYAGYIASLTR